MLDLKYTTYDITFQEVPNETQLVFNITGCPHKCEGCHSKYMWDYVGNFLKNDFEKVLNKYKDYITCVCFMGGDQNIEEIERYSKYVKEKYANIKVCIYSGGTNIKLFDNMIKNNYLDYLKIGPYIEKLGGLNSVNTNQIMYKIENNNKIDITYKFKKDYNAN